MTWKFWTCLGIACFLLYAFGVSGGFNTTLKEVRENLDQPIVWAIGAGFIVFVGLIFYCGKLLFKKFIAS